MFLSLNHQQLDVYTTSKRLVHECYKFTNTLPSEEKFGLISQIRRAALSVHLNIAEGASRRSNAERKRFYEIARSSVIEIDAALDIAEELSYVDKTKIDQLEYLIVKCFKMLTGMMNTTK